IESAAYRVMRERWGEVAIEIYHHPSHTYNLERMIDAVRKTLAYCSENFGPYQFRQLRILETPGYSSGAASFPNTIPYSETAGFIARVEGDRLDYPFYITAHEVAHQWWGHQVVPGNVQGAHVLTETLAQYSALMVMEKEYGADEMRGFLRYELDEYLFNRSLEQVGEVPLMVAERQKGVLYHKGAVIMYALRDYLGEQELNQALARFVAEVKFQPPPYPNTLELIAHLREAAPAEKQSLITDFFETITFFENRVAKASSTRRADGKYQVTIATESHKLRADAMGAETEIALDDWIDVGVFGGRIVDGKLEETVLFLDKRRVTAPEMTFEVVVDERPMRAGIDPYHKLIDRNGRDNVAPVAGTPPAAVDAGTAGG
ncbi:MAG: M1 family metallopeptidase, partial [bacterium]|nr:M1 family metallopeptidase [bacterium]